jgi:hypothetical protein
MNLTFFTNVQPILTYCGMVVETTSNIFLDDWADLYTLHIKWPFHRRDLNTSMRMK